MVFHKITLIVLQVLAISQLGNSFEQVVDKGTGLLEPFISTVQSENGKIERIYQPIAVKEANNYCRLENRREDFFKNVPSENWCKQEIARPKYKFWRSPLFRSICCNKFDCYCPDSNNCRCVRPGNYANSENNFKAIRYIDGAYDNK